jgi:hypothetical protein
MPGPLTEVKTEIAGIRLDTKRELTMAEDATTFGLYKPDGSEDEGVALIRAYDKGFCRIPEREKEIGDGRTVVFHIADSVDYPVGQLEDDLRAAKLVKLTEDGQVKWYSVTGAPEPASNEAQLYEITCNIRTMRQSYTRP